MMKHFMFQYLFECLVKALLYSMFCSPKFYEIYPLGDSMKKMA